MNNNKYLLFLLISIVSLQLFSQSAACNGTLPFEEKNGLLTIEMESGNLNDDHWEIGTETVDGEEIEYIHWTGKESFNLLSDAPIIYKIKINNPGTYRFVWRMRVGKGTSTTEHNDAWLKINGEDFYAARNGKKVYPKPFCNSNNEISCAAGKSTQNYIKAYGNRLNWSFTTNTNDNSAHKVYVNFKESKEYKITVDARSSYLFIDKMVLQRTGISDNVAFNLANNESSCCNTSLISNDKK